MVFSSLVKPVVIHCYHSCFTTLFLSKAFNIFIDLSILRFQLDLNSAVFSFSSVFLHLLSI